MNNKYEPVIGLEVHIELNTKSKMFCRCSADYFGKEPNTHACPICLGLPGALPYINKQAIEDCIKIGLALNCTISEKSLFERKNYFYPDLPKGFQVSQYRWPLCVGGWIEVENDQGEVSKIRINRAHQEEDTGKLTHVGSSTLMDFNRSSVPLVEVVTEPDFTETSQIRDYAKKLQQIVRFLGVSNADMERGDMRLEANISVRPVGQKELPIYRVELKNINSFRFMMAAVEYEIKRQTEAHEKGEKLIQETRGWDEDKKVTFTQRVKEEANDYRYFPEPDLQRIEIPRDEVEKIKSELPELPGLKMARFIKDFGLNASQAKVLTEDQKIAEFYETAVAEGIKHEISAIAIANYIINRKVDIEKTLPAEVIKNIVETKSGIIDSGDQLEALAKEAIYDNPEVVASYKGGKITAIMALVGAVMRKSSGKADASKVKEILEKLLS
ncbi:MAG: Asp-tRNA(Asn)/Glu-tRNA(Gln) amidotransferase subunit GatB [Candidatus Daviesbacteria bacterium]|nr:Asp-tRNA(Asn)/Glu-tRNA(Gln) amidotransferase subunit GatB [Candidatus Daviesbacteria bacterium]